MEKLPNDNKWQKQKGIGDYKSGTTQGSTIVKEIVPYPPQGADQPVEEDRWNDCRPTHLNYGRRIKWEKLSQ